MNPNVLVAMERLTLVLAAAATCAAGLAWGVSGAGGTALGGALAYANLWSTRKLARRAVGRVLEGVHPQATGLMMGMGIKMVVLFPVLWVAVSVLKVPLVPFALGLSVLVISLIAASLWAVAKGEAA